MLVNQPINAEIYAKGELEGYRVTLQALLAKHRSKKARLLRKHWEEELNETKKSIDTIKGILEFYNENTNYRFDITSFIYDELSDGFVEDGIGILIMLPETQFKGSLDRVVFDGRSSDSYRPLLNLYYVFYN